MSPPELILHHYDPSPFSEKVRLVLGLKQLTWRSVIQPMVLPKPDLVPLTGGNRRTPVLQVGANIYCGTNLIAAELERRHPEPTIYPSGSQGLAAMLSLWADEILFRPSSGYAIRDATHFPPDFYRDRAQMRGHAPIDRVQLTAEVPHHLAQLQIQLGYVEAALVDSRPYLFGEAPSLADFAAYARLWWAQLFGGDQGELSALPKVSGWRQRIAAIGDGTRREMAPAEALAVARDAKPEIPASVAAAAHPQVGTRVSMVVEGHGPDPVDGEVAMVTADAVALLREDADVGAVVVHLPRQGYAVSPPCPDFPSG